MSLFQQETFDSGISNAATESPAPLLELSVLGNPKQLSLEAKLKLESRACPICRYSIVNPMTDRCPRCFGAVPLSEHTNCGECSHQGNCTYKAGPP